MFASTYPQIIEAGNKLGWEWMGHGENNSTLINKQPEGRGARDHQQVVDTIAEGTGSEAARLAGSGADGDRTIRSTSWRRTASTTSATGCNDEQPYPMRVKSGTMYLDAVFDRDQRHPGLPRNAADRRGILPDDLRPVRHAVRGRRQERRASWRSACIRS